MQKSQLSPQVPTEKTLYCAKILLLVISMLIVQNQLFAQDSKINDLIQKSNSLQLSSPDSAIFYADIAEKEAAKTNNNYLEAKAIYNKGIAYYLKSDLNKANDNLTTAIYIFEKYNHQKELADAYKSLGDAYRELSSRLELATNHYVSALKIYQELDDKVGESEALIALGLLAQELRNFDQAAEYYLSASKLKNEMEDFESVAYIMHKIGQITIGAGKVEEGLQTCMTSLEISKDNGYEIVAAIIMNDLSKMFIMTGNLEKALEFLNESRSINNKLGNIKEEVDNLIGIATVKRLLKNHDECIIFANEAITLAEKNKLELSSYYRAYEQMAFCYKEIGEYKTALDYLIIYEEQEDSIFNAEKSSQVNELKIAYDTERKEAEIQNLKLEQEMQKAQEHRILFFLTLLIAALLLTTLIVFYRLYTQKKKSAAELEIAKNKAEQADKLKSEILANMSHEIRTPLNFINGSSALLKMEFKDNADSEIAEVFDSLDSGVKRLNRTIDLFVQMAQLKSGNYEVKSELINLNEVCEQIATESNISILSQNKDVVLKYNCSIDEPYLIADENSIRQIIGNIVDNAVKFTEKGSIEITIESHENNKLNLCICDTGIGISEEYAPFIFEPFTQEEMQLSRSYDGNGLGLALAKELARLNDIEIAYTSKKGEGTTFTLIMQKASIEE